MVAPPRTALRATTVTYVNVAARDVGAPPFHWVYLPEERYAQAYLDRKRMQYLYRDDRHFVFMDQETYEQTSLSPDLLGAGVQYLKEAAEATVVFYEGRPIALELPNSVELEVVETAPGVRGDTVAGGSKPARLETGTMVQVPFFVETGDRIRVDTRTAAYIERVR